MKVKLIPRPLRLMSYVREFRCRHGCPPQQIYDFLRGKYVVKQWRETSHQHFLIRDGNINSIRKLLPLPPPDSSSTDTS